MKPGKILAIRLSSMGDVAMTVPVLKEVLDQNPQLEIIMLSRISYFPLFRHLERVHFVGVDMNTYKGLYGIWRLAKVLKTLEFDAIADLHNVLRTKLLKLFLWKPGLPINQINKNRGERKKLTRQKNKVLKPLEPIPEKYAKVFQQLGLTVKLKKERQNHLGLSAKLNGGIGIAPFAAYEGKTYPPDRSLQIALELAKEGHQIYFFGGGSKEIEELNNWEKQHKNFHSLAGKLSLEEEIEHMAGLEIMLCMDSANMHLASLAGCRVISLWGATHPFAGFLGYGQKMEDTVQREDLDCRPCSIFGNKTCQTCKKECLNIPTVKLMEKLKT